MNVVPIVFAFDDNLVFPACVCLSSLMMSAHEDTFYDIFILHSASAGLRHGELDRVWDYYPHCRIQYVAVDDTFDGAYEVRGVTTPTYYRLLIPQLIPQYDKILYSDVDVIFRNDLREVYDMPLGGKYLAATYDLGVMTEANGHAHVKNVDGLNANCYIQAGFLVMNSKAIREAGLVQRFKDEAAKCYKYQDQDVLNVVCGRNVAILPYQWNVTTYVCQNLNLCQTYGEGKADVWPVLKMTEKSTIHYNGQKPWKGWCVNFDIWWEYYRRSPFYDEKFYFDFFYDKLNELEQLSLWKRVKVLVRYFVFGRQKSRLGR